MRKLVTAPALALLSAACAHASPPADVTQTKPPAPAAVAAGALPAAAVGTAAAQAADDAPEPGHPRLPRAWRLWANDTALGAFTTGAKPSADYPKGTLMVLGYSSSGFNVIEIDLAAQKEVRTISLGIEEGAAYYIASARTGPAVAVQTESDVRVFWLDGTTSIRVSERIGGLGTSSGYKLTGFTAQGDRGVLIGSNGKDFNTAAVVIDPTSVVAKHTCDGLVLDPFPANVEIWRGKALVTNLIGEHGGPVCAFGLERHSKTLEKVLKSDPQESIAVVGDDLYLEVHAANAAWKLNDDLVPVGPKFAWTPPPDPRDVCDGIGGRWVWQSANVEGLVIARTVSCCRDSHANDGLYVCDPRAKI